MNKVIQIGRFAKDPEVRYTENNKAIARFTIAVDRKYKTEGGPTADFHNCVAFGSCAEFIEKYFKQGSKIVVEGRLEDNNYTDKDGVKHYGKQITVEQVEFGESKGANTPADPQPDNDGFINLSEGLDDELPFN